MKNMKKSLTITLLISVGSLQASRRPYIEPQAPTEEQFEAYAQRKLDHTAALALATAERNKAISALKKDTTSRPSSIQDRVSEILNDSPDSYIFDTNLFILSNQFMNTTHFNTATFTAVKLWQNAIRREKSLRD